MEHTQGIVVAGSRAFVRAVATAFRQRRRVVVGIAGETERAFILANASGGLFVLEHGGEPWRALVEELQEARLAGLRIVAAIPSATGEGTAALDASSVDAVVPWDGAAADAVVIAGEALLAEGEALRAPPPRPVAPPVLQRVAAAPGPPSPAIAPAAGRAAELPALSGSPPADPRPADPGLADPAPAPAGPAAPVAHWDPCLRMAPCARIVTSRPSRWKGLSRLVASLLPALAVAVWSGARLG